MGGGGNFRVERKAGGDRAALVVLRLWVRGVVGGRVAGSMLDGGVPLLTRGWRYAVSPRARCLSPSPPRAHVQQLGSRGRVMRGVDGSGAFLLLLSSQQGDNGVLPPRTRHVVRGGTTCSGPQPVGVRDVAAKSG